MRAELDFRLVLGEGADERVGVNPEAETACLSVTAPRDYPVIGTGTATGTTDNSAASTTTHRFSAPAVRDVVVAVGSFDVLDRDASGVRLHLATPQSGTKADPEDWAEQIDSAITNIVWTAGYGGNYVTMSNQYTSEIFERRESAVRSYCRNLNAVLVRARGSVVQDKDGRQYIDFLAGAGALNYGHNDPDMKQALLNYVADDGIAHGPDLHTDAKRAFLENLEHLILLPRKMSHRVQFTGPTGANAVEAALKLARKATGRTNVIAFTRGFHGLSQGALAATANAGMRGTPVLPLPRVSRFPFDGYLGPDFDTTELPASMLADPSSGLDAPAAILVETVQGEGGLNAAVAPQSRRARRGAGRPPDR